MFKNFETREACFACTTPYQVIGAISITKSNDMDADIYIFGMFPGYDSLAKRLEDLNIFKNVYAVDCDKFSFMGKGKSSARVQIEAFLQVAFAGHFVKEFLDKNVRYNYFYSSSRAHIKLLLQRVLKKRNPELRVEIYDDGLGSYLEDSHVLRTSKKRQSIEKVLRWNLFEPNFVSIQLYLPNIAQIPKELRVCPLTEMPRLDWNDFENKDILKKLFGVTDSKSYDERVIVFDNVRGSKLRIDMFKSIDECYQVICDIAKDEAILKYHPRSVSLPSLPMKCVEEQGTPMEVFYADMDDLDSRVLVAYNSTTVYTPKMLFGKEPWIICLHRIVGPPLGDNAEDLYNTFVQTYDDKNKILVPNSIEELRLALNDVLERK